MKVTLTSHSANHLLRLAEGLQKHDVLNRFYTIYPQFKLVGYDIDKKYVRSFRSLGALAYVLRKFGVITPEKIHSGLFDHFTALMLCFDRSVPTLVQGNNGYFLRTLRLAKRRGAKTILDRACPHINFQLSLLDEEVELLTGKKNQISSNHRLKDQMIAEYAEADAIIVPSTYSYNSFIQQGIPQEKLNIVPLMKEKNVTRGSENNEKNSFTVLAVGFSFYRKGFYYLLKAWHELNLPNAQLIIRTTIPKEFQYLLAHPSIKAINHHLSTPDLIKLYQQCDVFCLPSVDEGFGMAAVEGMAAGKPIIVTNNVGMNDIITDKKEGFVLPIRNIDAIKESITTLYEDRDLARQMGECAYQTEQQYSQTRYIETILLVYRDIAANDLRL